MKRALTIVLALLALPLLGAPTIVNHGAPTKPTPSTGTIFIPAPHVPPTGIGR